MDDGSIVTLWFIFSPPFFMVGGLCFLQKTLTLNLNRGASSCLDSLGCGLDQQRVFLNKLGCC